MDGEKDKTIPENPEKSFPWRGLFLWAFVVVAIYFLSMGPVLKVCFESKSARRFEHLFDTVYAPWFWSYDHTPLRKPLGIYMHLWLPDDFDRHGEVGKG